MLAARLSVLVVRAAARPATGGLPDGVPFWFVGLGSYPIHVLLDLLDLAALGDDGGPKHLPYSCLIAQRRKGQKYPCQTGVPFDKLVPYAAEEQCIGCVLQGYVCPVARHIDLRIAGPPSA